MTDLSSFARPGGYEIIPATAPSTSRGLLATEPPAPKPPTILERLGLVRKKAGSSHRQKYGMYLLRMHAGDALTDRELLLLADCLAAMGVKQADIETWIQNDLSVLRRCDASEDAEKELPAARAERIKALEHFRVAEAAVRAATDKLDAAWRVKNVAEAGEQHLRGQIISDEKIKIMRAEVLGEA